jgi:hypothetical protein
MATRQSMDDFFQRCEQVIKEAEEQFDVANKQEHYNTVEYTNALQHLEESYNDLADLAHSANGQQREQLHRMRLRIQQLQNTMILQ